MLFGGARDPDYDYGAGSDADLLPVERRENDYLREHAS
jgi:hypothetical protein